MERIRRETVFLSPLIEAALCGLTGGEEVSSNSPNEAWSSWRIGIKAGEFTRSGRNGNRQDRAAFRVYQEAEQR